jgi:hypothetical protein
MSRWPCHDRLRDSALNVAGSSATKRIMRRFAFSVVPGALVLLLFACGGEDVSRAGAAGPDDPNGNASTQAPQPGEGGANGANNDAGNGLPNKPDAGPSADATSSTDPLAPKPPSGAKACGAGTFTAAQAAAECQSGGSFFASIVTQPSPCGALTMTSGEWQAWCTETATYVWTKFRGVAVPTGAQGCTAWNLFPFYRAGNGGGSTGNNEKSGYAGSPDPTISSTPRDFVIWTTTGSSSSTTNNAATLYLGASPDTFTPSCKQTPTKPHLFFGATGTSNK